MTPSAFRAVASKCQRQSLAAVKPPRHRRHPGVARALSLPVKGPLLSLAPQLDHGGGGSGSGSDSDEGDDDSDGDDDGLYWPDRSLQLYLDSADTRSWRKWADTGLFYGKASQARVMPGRAER